MDGSARSRKSGEIISITQSPMNFVRRLKKEPNELRKKTLLLAYLFGRLSKQGVESCLVGGEAVELYTAGQFMTGDIDITTSDESAAEKLFVRLGFKREGMIWLNEELRIAVQIVARYPSRTEKVRSIEVGGVNIKVVGVEDLIVDRLVAAKFWRSNTKLDTEQAAVLLYNFKKSIDLEYLRKRVSEERVEDFFQDIQRHRV